MRRNWIVAILYLLLSSQSAGQPGATTRVSVSSSGEQANGGVSYPVSISADGRYVAFQSNATNLVLSDTNGVTDVFVRDRRTGYTARVSVSSSGDQANNESYVGVSISADGRFVGFLSSANNLVEGDTNALPDAFVHDRLTAQTSRVSVSSTGEQGNGQTSFGVSVSADGRYVAFFSLASNLAAGASFGNVFRHDRQSGQTICASVSHSGNPGGADTKDVSISSDGRFVAFSSKSSLVSGDTNIGYSDVFVRDCNTSETTRVSVSSLGAQGYNDSYHPSISGDGRYVAFFSVASELVPEDSNNRSDVFVRDRQTNQTSRVSINSAEEQGLNNCSGYLAISDDGRFVSFGSSSWNLVPNDTNGFSDIFVRDRLMGLTTRASVSSSGSQVNSHTGGPVSISGDGRFVSFPSEANNVVLNDTNAVVDVFVHQFGPSKLRSIELNVSVVKGGTTVGAKVSFDEPAPIGGANVLLSSSNELVARVPQMVTVLAGQTNRIFNVTTLGQTIGRSVTITAKRAGIIVTANLTIQPALLSSLGITPAVVTGGMTAIGTITLDGPAPVGGANVLLFSSDSEAATAPVRVTVPAGQTSKTFPVTTFAVTTQRSVIVTATRAGISKTKAVTINP